MSPPPISSAILVNVRRAILDLMLDIGGTQNDDSLSILLAELGHLIPQYAVVAQMRWLAEHDLLIVEEVGSFTQARSTHLGRDVARGRLKFEGVSPYKTGE